VRLRIGCDCHVFILSRVREAVDAAPERRPPSGGSIATTAGVVTAAAAVMVCVFALFDTYLPRRLHWLPRLAHEPAQSPYELMPSLEVSR
jgi:MMPL family